MRAEQLIIKHLDIWTSAHKTRSSAGRGSSSKLDLYGIKKLRELILELAVRGKLVPQEPNDEPASELLERIRAEKKVLINDGKVKKEKIDPDLQAQEIFESLPNSWCWTSLKEIALINPRNYATDDLEVSFVPMALIDSRFDGGHLQEIKKWGEVKQGFTHFAEGDIGIAKITPCFENSKACVFKNLKNMLGAGTTELHVIRPIANTINPSYVLAFLKSPSFLKIGETKMTGTAGQKRLPKDFLETHPFSLPPLKEQHRIVCKIVELMAFCDQLEQAQTDSIDAHAKLVEALLTTLTDSKDHQELQANWQRIAEHFDTLFTTEESIDQLKQTILQLAVMGKLVPQDPNDEPASELLKKIAAEKAQLIKEGKIKKEKPLPEITEEEKPFELPNGWEFVRLQKIINISSGDGLTANNMNPEGGIPVFGGNGINGYHDRYNLNKPTIVIGRVGYYCGSIHITPEKAWVTDNAFETKFSENNIYINFLYWLLLGTNLKENENATAQPVISGAKVYPIVVGLPPLNEQHRIVDKLVELMTVCDSVIKALQSTKLTEISLVDSLVEMACC